MDIAPALLLAALVWQVIDFLRDLANWSTQRSSAVTQATAWIGGVVVVVLAAHAALFDQFTVNGLTLTALDGASQIYLGLCIASLASSAVDLKQAFDGNDSAKVPPLL